jgi:hypothetical protein
VVVPHSEPRLTLIGVRDPDTGVEFRPSLWSELPSVREFPLQSIDDVLTTFGHLNPVETEGYVIVDADFRRIKVKHPGYVALHHLKDGVCPRRLLEIVRAGESSELLTHFPEYAAEADAIRGKLDSLVAEVVGEWVRLRGIEERKAFAMQATKTRVPAALFALKDGRFADPRAFFADYNVKHLMHLLGMKDTEPQREAA